MICNGKKDDIAWPGYILSLNKILSERDIFPSLRMRIFIQAGFMIKSGSKKVSVQIDCSNDLEVYFQLAIQGQTQIF